MCWVFFILGGPFAVMIKFLICSLKFGEFPLQMHNYIQF